MRDFMSRHSNVTNTHLRRDFIAINKVIHSSTTSEGDQWTNALT